MNKLAMQKAFEKGLFNFKKDNPGGDAVSYLRGWNRLGTHQATLPVLKKSGTIRKKLNESMVKSIRRDFSNGMKQSEIGKKYELKGGTVSGIVNNKTWRDI
jgi:hypothetical protein